MIRFFFSHPDVHCHININVSRCDVMDWTVSPQSYVFKPWYLRMLPYWEIVTWLSWDKVILEFGETYNPITSTLIKRGKIRQRKRHIQGKNSMWYQKLELHVHNARNTQPYWQLQKLKRETNQIFLTASKGKQYCWHLDFRFLASKTLRQHISAVLRHAIWGTLLQQTQEISAWLKVGMSEWNV